MPLAASIILLIIVFFNAKKDSYHKGIAIFGLAFFYILVSVRHTGTIYGAIYILIIPIYLFIDKYLLVRSYEKFIKILSIVLIPSIISYVLVNYLNIQLPYTIINPLNELKEISYLKYPFFVTDDVYRGLSLYRFYSIYDEPGVIGSLSAIVLCIKRFDFKANKFLIPFLIAGLLSFSLYFYVICTIYIFLFAQFKYKILIGTLLVVIIPVLILNDDLNILIFKRFTFENGKWLGNSRYASNFSKWYSNFSGSKDYLFGLGSGASNTYNFGGASYKDIIVNYGIFYFILYVVSLLYMAYNKNKINESILASLMILSFIYQRPFIFDLHILLTFVYCAYSSRFLGTKIISK